MYAELGMCTFELEPVACMGSCLQCCLDRSCAYTIAHHGVGWHGLLLAVSFSGSGGPSHSRVCFFAIHKYSRPTAGPGVHAHPPAPKSQPLSRLF